MARRKIIVLSEPPKNGNLEEKLVQDVKDVLLKCRQDSLGKAIIADVIDAVPYLRIATHLLRFFDGVKNDDMVAAGVHGADLFVSEGQSFEGIGSFIPANTILTYIKLKNEGKKPIKELKEQIKKKIKM